MGPSSPFVFPSFSVLSLGTMCFGHSWDYFIPRLPTKFSPWLQKQKALKDNSSAPCHAILGDNHAWSNHKFEHWTFTYNVCLVLPSRFPTDCFFNLSVLPFEDLPDYFPKHHFGYLPTIYEGSDFSTSSSTLFFD